MLSRYFVKLLSTPSALRAFCLGLVTIFLMSVMPGLATIDALAAPPPPSASLPDFTILVEKVGPAVVNIRTTEQVQARVRNGLSADVNSDELVEFFQRFFGFSIFPPQSERGQPYAAPDTTVPIERNSGLGSGFIISADGYILTSAHVLEEADNIYVRLVDKREFKARLIGADVRTDIALIKIDANKLPVAAIGDSNKVRVGEWVLAIGSPFGFDSTVTAGIVSAKARTTGTEYLPFIQTDVAVNPGNSGGPLINMQGEVIGINSQIYSRTGGFMGISFAIPIDEAMRVVKQLKATGRVARGRLGVVVSPVTQDVADLLKLPRANGALINRVEPASPAAHSGIQAGDIVLKFNGKSIDNASDLSRLVGESKPGTHATVSVWRKGKIHHLPVTVAQEPSTIEFAQSKKPASNELAKNSLGLGVSDIPEQQLKALKLKQGVWVEAVNGPAARAGLRKGDVVLRVGDTDIVNAAQFNQIARALNLSKRIALLVRRNGITQFIPVQPQAGK